VEEKIAKLQEIESDRVKYMRRWNSVKVWADGDTLIIYWNGPKPDNPGWQFHKKERPLNQIDYLIKYHKKKLELFS
jgi:hypothetical protein